MACRGFWECLLKVLNFLLILVGLAMIGYGVYLFVEYKNAADLPDDDTPISPSNGEFIQLGRPMLVAVSLADNIFDKLPKAWFIYLFTGLGAVVLFIACCGCIGAATRNGCCLTCYSLLVILLILVELGLAAFIFFDKSWKEEIPVDKTGNFDTVYEFLDKHWKVIRWVALGVVTLEMLVAPIPYVARTLRKGGVPVSLVCDMGEGYMSDSPFFQQTRLFQAVYDSADASMKTVAEGMRAATNI